MKSQVRTIRLWALALAAWSLGTPWGLADGPTLAGQPASQASQPAVAPAARPPLTPLEMKALEYQRAAFAEARLQARRDELKAKRERRNAATSLPAEDQEALSKALQVVVEGKSETFAAALTKLQDEYGQHALAQAAAVLKGHRLCKDHLTAWATAAMQQYGASRCFFWQKDTPVYHKDLLDLYMANSDDLDFTGRASMWYAWALRQQITGKEDQASVLRLARKVLSNVVEKDGASAGGQEASLLIGQLGDKDDKPLLAKAATIKVKPFAGATFNTGLTLKDAAHLGLIRLGEVQYKKAYLDVLKEYRGGNLPGAALEAADYLGGDEWVAPLVAMLDYEHGNEWYVSILWRLAGKPNWPLCGKGPEGHWWVTGDVLGNCMSGQQCDEVRDYFKDRTTQPATRP